MKKGENLKSGFTIIEVALVIAIAGLIFLMVFVALPALRRNQRDTQRRDDLISFLSNVKKYQTNNRGSLPGGGEVGGAVWSESWTSTNPAGTTWGGFYRDYLGDDFIDPSGERYNVKAVACNAASSSAGADCIGKELGDLNTVDFPNGYNIIVVLQASCSGEKAVLSSNPRKLAALYRLEGGGIYCGNT